MNFDASTIGAIDEGELAGRIASAGSTVGVVFTIDGLYHSDSKEELAIGWLKAWYIAELLAQVSKSISYEVQEADNGSGELRFTLTPMDPSQLAVLLKTWGPAFDPDDETGAEPELVSEAEGWSEDRGNVKSRFPELEQNYLADFGALNESDDEV